MFDVTRESVVLIIPPPLTPEGVITRFPSKVVPLSNILKELSILFTAYSSSSGINHLIATSLLERMGYNPVVSLSMLNCDA